MDLLAATKTVTLPVGSFPLVDAGSGQPVLLLHGFPDSRHLWRHQIPALAGAGFRVIAPDLRGFGDAPRPSQPEQYRLPYLLDDVLGIVSALGMERPHVVGHDFGARLAWALATYYGARFGKIAVLAVGAPNSPGWNTIPQREKRWYVDFFCKAGIAEQQLTANDWKLMRDWLRGQGDQERFLRDLSRPGALTAGLNWYRATFLPLQPGEPAPPELPARQPIRNPMLGIWSDGDPFCLEPQMVESAGTVEGPWRYERIAGASHWMMLDRPDEVNRLLLGFLQA